MFLATTRSSLSCVSRQCSRAFSALPALHTPLPSSAAEEFTDPKAGKVQVTTLPQGLRVASIDNGGNLSTVGVFLNAGSRDEDHETFGSTLTLRHLALKSTQGRSGFRLIRELERMGANVTVSSHHEQVVYSGDVLRPAATAVVSVLAETLLYPALLPWEVKEAASQAAAEVDHLQRNPPALITEHMHTAAYGGATLGQPLYAPPAVYHALTADAVARHLHAATAQGTLVVAGVNVDHAALLDAAQASFGSLPARPSLERARAQYTGGDLRTAVADSDGAVVGVVFEGAAWSSPDIVHVSLLQTVLGGGSYFSAGGPGKGMLSRLYTNVLNRYEDVRSANSFNMFYSDSGVFGVYGETSGALAGSLVDVLSQELLGLGRSIGPEELQRAKNQLKSSIVMNVEQSYVLLDDVGRQVLALGKHHPPAELLARIDAVTASELTATAQKIFKSPLTLVAHGSIQNVPRYDTVLKRFQ